LPDRGPGRVKNKAAFQQNHGVVIVRALLHSISMVGKGM
jgi:hypothetical protein